MSSIDSLANEIKKYRSICYYPSSGIDLSDIDFFASGKLLWEERINPQSCNSAASADFSEPSPDLFIHSDINFYQEFDAGFEMSVEDRGIHGKCEVVDFRELERLENPNLIYNNFDFSGRCFEYRLKVWDRLVTLIYCLCENEFLVSRVLLANKIKVGAIWSRNWAGGRTYGTWLANVLDLLQTEKLYSDWLCIPGKRGEPGNRAVEEKYPELIKPRAVRLAKNEETRWIDEGAHGWVEEYDVIQEIKR